MTRRGQAGFTLLELLIAIALLGLLTTVAYGGVEFAIVSWRRAEHHRADAADRVAVERVLRQAIAGAYPQFASASLADRSVAFEGGQDTLALVAPLPAAIEAGIMAQQHFFLKATDDGPQLTMGWRLDLPASDGGALPETLVPLLAHVGAIRFAFFGPRPPAPTPGWSDQWTGMAALPELVRVRVWRQGVSNTADNNAAWLEIIISTETTTSIACVYDPSEVNCRRIR